MVRERPVGTPEKLYDSAGMPLRWFEYLMCCCKCRAECKSCQAVMWLYYIPSIILIALAAGCITFGIIWRTCCSYQEMVPYWLLRSAVSPFLLLFSVKAVKEEYLGVTCWRLVSFFTYLVFVSWLIIGSTWVYDTWANACDSCCNKYLKWYAFLLSFVHWFFVVLATIPQIYILTRMCCCCDENAVKPLKHNFLD